MGVVRDARFGAIKRFDLRCGRTSPSARHRRTCGARRRETAVARTNRGRKFRMVSVWARDGGARITMMPETLLFRRVHDSNMSRTGQAEKNEYARILKASLDRRRAAK